MLNKEAVDIISSLANVGYITVIRQVLEISSVLYIFILYSLKK